MSSMMMLNVSQMFAKENQEKTNETTLYCSHREHNFKLQFTVRKGRTKAWTWKKNMRMIP